MRSAVIVVGGELRFWEQSQEFESYLRRECRLRYVSVVEGWKRSYESMKSVLGFKAIGAGRQPFLLAYIGHGYESGWSYGVSQGDEELRFPYKDLLSLLREHRQGPTLILNDCCHAGAVADLKVRETPQFEKGAAIGVIAACEQDGYAYGRMVDSVTDSWRQFHHYTPKIRMHVAPGAKPVQEHRFGRKYLDVHFFPKSLE